jgi:hypothetical protein
MGDSAMPLRLLIDSATQFHWRLPVTTLVIGITVLILIARRVRAAEQTAARRQLWYVPLFIGGFESVGVLSLAMQCSFGTTPRENINNLMLVAGSVAIMVVLTLALGAIGQSVSSGERRMMPPAGACGAAMSVIATWGFVLGIFHAVGGIPLSYLP